MIENVLLCGLKKKKGGKSSSSIPIKLGNCSILGNSLLLSNITIHDMADHCSYFSPFNSLTVQYEKVLGNGIYTDKFTIELMDSCQS